MNILILTTHMNTGGIAQYISVLARGLRSRGVSVVVVSSGGDKAADLAACGIEHIILNIRTKSELSWKLYAALGPLIRLVKEKNIDVIHAQTRVAQVLGTLLAQLTGKPMVSTCHGFFRPRVFRRIFPCWGRAVIAISKPVQEHLSRDFKVSSKKNFLIFNGIDLKEFSEIPAGCRQKQRENYRLGEGPVVGIIARLSDVKGHDVLIRAFEHVCQRYPKAKLFIAGRGKEEQRLKSLVEDLGLQTGVVFVPIVGKTAEILSAFDVFVMPSLQEGLGLSVMEAQASGLPVVASRVGGIPSLIEDGKTGLLVKPADVEGLSLAILRVLDNKEYAGNLAAAGQKFVRENFSAEKMVEETLKVYRFVVGGS